MVKDYVPDWSGGLISLDNIIEIDCPADTVIPSPVFILIEDPDTEHTDIE